MKNAKKTQWNSKDELRKKEETEDTSTHVFGRGNQPHRDIPVEYSPAVQSL